MGEGRPSRTHRQETKVLFFCDYERLVCHYERLVNVWEISGLNNSFITSLRKLIGGEIIQSKARYLRFDSFKFNYGRFIQSYVYDLF